MKINTVAMIIITNICVISTGWVQAFVHPGCLSTQEDLDRIAIKVATDQEPWKSAWEGLLSNTGGHLTFVASPQEQVYAQSISGHMATYQYQMWDSHVAYQCALRYSISGETGYGDKAIEIMNAWSSTHIGGGDSNSNGQLRTGLYGFVFACTGELMRNYDGWGQVNYPTSIEDGEVLARTTMPGFKAFQKYMHDRYYTVNKGFLTWHNGTCDTHYWANWELASMTSALAIGVLCDGLDDSDYPTGQEMFDYVIDYYYNGVGNGNINNLIYHIHPNGLAQWQELGRDQGHATMGVPQLGSLCEIAWNQGVDLYSELDNAFLSTCEHIAKHNLFYEIPYVTHVQCDYWVGSEIGTGQGFLRQGYDLVYNHYVNRLGLSAPYSQEAAEELRPDTGPQYRLSSDGAYDQVGFTTLTHSLDPIADANYIPSCLRPHIKGAQVTLSWRGTPYADSYYVKRSTISDGPYTTLATVGRKNTYYVDTGLVPGTTYYYVVSANNPNGESPDSFEVAATADGQLVGTILGTEGSMDGYGLSKDTLFDGCLRNFFDAPTSVGWGGLDLGEGVSAIITGVRFCPRPDHASRMVGGEFQGSNTSDFSDDVKTFHTITSTPSYGELTFGEIETRDGVTDPFRYVRYLGPSGSYCNAAEIQFLGTLTGLDAPATPVVTALLTGGNQAGLTWDTVEGATSYTIKRATVSGGPYTILENGPKASYTDKKLPLNTSYYYVVSALNQAGESINSTEVSVTTQSSTENLVAHYQFDGNLTDSAGYGYHGTASGEPSYMARSVGQAIVLDGDDDAVTVPAGLADSNDITIATWVYWNGDSTWQRLFDFGEDTSQYLFLSPRSGDNTLRFAIKDGDDEQIVETTQLAKNQWIHVAVTLDGDTGKLYVNGQLKDTNTSITINPSDYNPSSNYIGDSQWSADPMLNGNLDDFRVYNYALSQEEILALATPASADTTAPVAPLIVEATTGDGTVWLDWLDNSESDLGSYSVYRATTSGGPYSVRVTGLTSSEYTDTAWSNDITYYYVVTASDTTLNESAYSDEISVTPTSSFIPTLIVQYDFDGDTVDTSGNDNNATTSGSPSYVEGLIGQAIDLDGSSDVVHLPAGVANSDDITVAAWVYWHGGSAWQRIFDFGNDTSNYLFVTPSSGSDTLLFEMKHTGYEDRYFETDVLASEQWVHVALTLNGDTATLYVDGVAVKRKTDVTVNPSDFNPTQNYIGKSQYPDALFDGSIDDFRVYNYALADEDILELAGQDDQDDDQGGGRR